MLNVEKQLFGFLDDGGEVYRYNIVTPDLKLSVLNLGATVQSLCVRDKNGAMRDVALGFDTVYDYTRQTFYMGAVVGRCANRTANGEFVLNGQKYTLFKNDGRNHLHGGKTGFDKKLWRAETLENGISFTLESPDGDEGYPGRLCVTVNYILQNETELRLEYRAVSDKTTVCNLTNHTYFNLSGGKDILSHRVKLYSNAYSPTDEENIPLGTLEKTDNTPMDFKTPGTVGEKMNFDFAQIKKARGYDHNFAVENYDGTLRPCAEIYSPESGISLDVYTTLPGMQFYTGNFINGNVPGKGGAVYGPYGGLCVETQYFPNAVNNGDMPSPIINANKVQKSVTLWRFSENSQNAGAQIL